MWITYAYNVASDLVNCVLQQASSTIYMLALYNLGGSLILNFAQDVNGQNYFECQRQLLKLDVFIPGVVQSTADSSTSAGFLDPEFMKYLTFDDLQRLKDRWGRQYLAFAQMYGPSIWGVS